jgi:hypothetical protein
LNFTRVLIAIRLGYLRMQIAIQLNLKESSISRKRPRVHKNNSTLIPNSVSDPATAAAWSLSRCLRVVRSLPSILPLKLMTFQSVNPSFDPWLGVFTWIMWLGPIALLWIVGGTVIGTTRWVMRGFTRRSDTKRA